MTDFYRRIPVCGIAVCALLMALPAAAQPAGAHRPETPQLFVAAGMDSPSLLRLFDDPQIVSDLQLTTSQVEQIRRGKYEFLRQAVELKSRVSLARLELEQMLEEGEAENKQAIRIVDKVNRCEKDLEKLLVAQTAQQNKILTRDQRQLLMQLAQKRRQQRPADASEAEASGQSMAADAAGLRPEQVDWDAVLKMMEEVYDVRRKQ